MKNKLVEHFVKFSVIYGSIGFLAVSASAIFEDKLIAFFRFIACGHSDLQIIYIALYLIFLCIPACFSTVYAAYIMVFAAGKRKSSRRSKSK